MHRIVMILMIEIVFIKIWGMENVLKGVCPKERFILGTRVVTFSGQYMEIRTTEKHQFSSLAVCSFDHEDHDKSWSYDYCYQSFPCIFRLIFMVALLNQFSTLTVCFFDFDRSWYDLRTFSFSLRLQEYIQQEKRREKTTKLSSSPRSEDLRYVPSNVPSDNREVRYKTVLFLDFQFY